MFEYHSHMGMRREGPSESGQFLELSGVIERWDGEGAVVSWQTVTFMLF